MIPCNTTTTRDARIVWFAACALAALVTAALASSGCAL